MPVAVLRLFACLTGSFFASVPVLRSSKTLVRSVDVTLPTRTFLVRKSAGKRRANLTPVPVEVLCDCPADCDNDFCQLTLKTIFVSPFLLFETFRCLKINLMRTAHRNQVSPKIAGLMSVSKEKLWNCSAKFRGEENVACVNVAVFLGRARRSRDGLMMESCTCCHGERGGAPS